MSDTQIRDEVATILLAGHETTANALAWTWYLLSGDTAVAARLHAELAVVLGGRAPTAEDLPNLVYTRMVIEEAMRLYPPAHSFSRQAIAEDRIAGRTIPAGAVVIIAPWLLHRHRKLWEIRTCSTPKTSRRSGLPPGRALLMCHSVADCAVASARASP